MWKALERHTNAAQTTAGATNLRMKFMNDKLKDSDTISDYVSRLIGYQTQLVHTDEALSDRTVITQILNTLPSKFEGIIRHIKDKPISDQTIDSVLDTLLEHERTTYLPEPLESQALFTRKKGRKPHHVSDRNKGSKSRHPYRRDNTRAPTCWYCTREGHRESECAIKRNAEEARKQRISNRRTNNDHHADVVRLNLTQTSYSRACLAKTERSTWYIDSGASKHMCSQFTMFKSTRPLDPPEKVILGDNSTIFATAIGTIALEGHQGR